MKYAAARTCHAGAVRTCHASAYDADVSRRDWPGAPPTAQQYFDGSTLIFYYPILFFDVRLHRAMHVKLLLQITLCRE